ncbi:MAG: flagellar hook-length control protein FliK [Treponema sp.]|nr:flagellar hook-length control protein FliK [Treponema sp.]
MQYLKVQYARTDVLAKTTETYTKESKSSSNSFQSILNSLQSQTNNNKIDSKQTSFQKENSTDANINSSVSKEEKREDNKKDIPQISIKKEKAQGKEVEEPVQVETENNHVYMLIDLSASEIDNSDPLKNLALDEENNNIEFISDSSLESVTEQLAPESTELEEMASEIAANSSTEIVNPKQTSEEKAIAPSEMAVENEPITPKDNFKENSEIKFAKNSFGKTEKSDTVSDNKKVFTVFDERTVPAQEEEKKVISEVKNLKGSSEQHQNTQASMISENINANILSTNDQSASATGSTFQQMLSQQIQQNAPEFAKAGTIILKDQNSGSINMVLRPESLGNVKISLQLTDKNISGHIIVQSKEAMEAFKENLDLLRHSFQENGFENAQLSLSLADSSSENQFAQNQSGNDGQLVAGRAYKEYGQSGEENITSTDSSQYSSSGEYQIDVVA